jgi:glycerophosphoryl diester phosphodiesterase
MGARPHVVVIGAGFGGLAAAKRLEDEAVDVTLIDRHNYHSFQPLLYQVATAGLNAADFGSTPQLVKAAAGAGTGPVLWSPSGNDVTPAAVKEAQSMGFQVIPWTINKQVDMTNLMRLGIDGIITDYPDVLRNVVRSQGLPMPLPAGPVN